MLLFIVFSKKTTLLQENIRKSHADHIYRNLGENEYFFAIFMQIFCFIPFAEHCIWSNPTHLNISSQMWSCLWSIYSREGGSFSFSVTGGLL